MDQKIIELLNKKISELKNILSNNEFVIDTQYDYIDKKNLEKKLKKIRELVEDKNTDVETIMLHKNIGKPLYNVLVYDVLKKYEKQQFYNRIIRYFYIFVLLGLIGLSSYLIINTPTEKIYQEKIIYKTGTTSSGENNKKTPEVNKKSLSEIYSLYKSETVTDKKLQELKNIGKDIKEKDANFTNKEAEQKAQDKIDQGKSFKLTTVLNINLREKAGTENPIVDVVPNGTKITIKDYTYVQGYAWYKTSYQNQTGWISWVGVDKPGLFDN